MKQRWAQNKGLFQSAPFLGAVLTLTLTIILLVKKTSIGLSMGGLPVSDASGWSSCSRSLGLYGEWPSNDMQWCFRRPLYPIVNSILFRFLHEAQFVLVFWNILFSVSLYFFWKASSKLINFVSTIIVAVVVFLWLRQAATQMMSEQLGIILGLWSATFFWIFLSKRSLSSALYCVTFFSASQVARPGNLLLLLLLPVFFFTLAGNGKFKKFIHLSLAVTLPFLCVKIFAWIFKIQGFMSSENSWATLYGFTKDNSSYTTAYDDFADSQISETIFWSKVKDAAIQNILNDPYTTLTSFRSNIFELLTNIPGRFLNIGISREYSILFLIILIILTVFNPIIWWRRNSHAKGHLLYMLFAAFFVFSEVLVYALVLKSDPVRAMSSSLPLIVSVLISIACLSKWQSHQNVSNARSESNRNLSLVNVVPSIMFFTLILATGGIGSSKTINSWDSLCPSGTNNYLLVRSTPSVEVFRIRTNSDFYWWQSFVSSLPDGLLVQGLVLNKDDKIDHSNLFLPGIKSLPENSAYLCVVKTNKFKDNLDPIGFESAVIAER